MGERLSMVITGGILVIGLVAAWVFISSGREEIPPSVSEITDTAVIQSSSELSHLSIATSENFAQQKIYVISAYVKNLSGKPLRMAEVKMVFTDFDGKPIHEYTQKILNPTQKPIAAGAEFRFEVRQENLPRGWNYRVPVTQITKLAY